MPVAGQPCRYRLPCHPTRSHGEEFRLVFRGQPRPALAADSGSIETAFGSNDHQAAVKCLDRRGLFPLATIAILEASVTKWLEPRRARLIERRSTECPPRRGRAPSVRTSGSPRR